MKLDTSMLHLDAMILNGFRSRPYLPRRGAGVSDATREHELMAQHDLRNGRRYVNFVRVAMNRIKFRHDDKRGPISATLPHAIY